MVVFSDMKSSLLQMERESYEVCSVSRTYVSYIVTIQVD